MVALSTLISVFPNHGEFCGLVLGGFGFFFGCCCVTFSPIGHLPYRFSLSFKYTVHTL